jgi:hypothetical protein
MNNLVVKEIIVEWFKESFAREFSGCTPFKRILVMPML